MYYQPACAIDPSTGMRTECIGNPTTYKTVGIIFGALIGGFIGIIFLQNI